MPVNTPVTRYRFWTHSASRCLLSSRFSPLSHPCHSRRIYRSLSKPPFRKYSNSPRPLPIRPGAYRWRHCTLASDITYTCISHAHAPTVTNQHRSNLKLSNPSESCCILYDKYRRSSSGEVVITSSNRIRTASASYPINPFALRVYPYFNYDQLHERLRQPSFSPAYSRTHYRRRLRTEWKCSDQSPAALVFGAYAACHTSSILKPVSPKSIDPLDVMQR